jgi:CRP/FNR family cyclic AMP-dependent transcriptional regulator
MNVERAADLLGETPMFGSLGRPASQLLAEQAETLSYPSHRTIFKEGEPGDALYVIAEGMVKLEVRRRSGERFLLTTLQRPDTFGELSLLHGGVRSATAVTLAPTTLLSINKAAFVALLVQEPTLASAVLGTFGSLIRRLTEQTADLALLDLKGRVARVLVTLAEKQVKVDRDDPAPVLEIRLTQNELAQMTGGSRQSINQVLAAFQTTGMVELRNRTVVIKSLELLRGRAGG